MTRVSDGMILNLEGNLNDPYPGGSWRYYIMTVLANQVYRVEVVPAPANLFLYKNITVDLRDMGSCNQGLTLQFKQAPDNPLVPLDSDDIVYPK